MELVQKALEVTDQHSNLHLSLIGYSYSTRRLAGGWCPKCSGCQWDVCWAPLLCLQLCVWWSWLTWPGGFGGSHGKLLRSHLPLSEASLFGIIDNIYYLRAFFSIKKHSVCWGNCGLCKRTKSLKYVQAFAKQSLMYNHLFVEIDHLFTGISAFSDTHWVSACRLPLRILWTSWEGCQAKRCCTH